MNFFLDGLIEGFNLILNIDKQVFEIALRSSLLAFFSTILASSLAIPLGFFIAKCDFFCKKGIIVILNTLLSLPTVFVGLMIYGLFSRQGILGFMNLLYTPKVIVLAQVVLILPLITALTVTTISALDARIKITSLTLGATFLQATWMDFKEARFSILSSLAAAFGRVITEVGAAIMVGGNIKGYTRTLTTTIALETSQGNFSQGMALGIILLMISLGLNLVSFLIQSRWD